MDPDRRRQIAREVLDAIDAIPIGVDGRGDFTLNHLTAAMKIEADLIGRLTDEMERGHAVQVALDGALVALGGWRHFTLAEQRGEAAAAFSRSFRAPAVYDK